MTSIAALEKFGSVRRALNRLALQKLKHIGLGTKQTLVIRVVGQKGECSITELAETSDSDLAAVSRMIGTLVKNGWLTKSAHPSDARQSVIRLGQKAKRRMAEIESIVEEIAKDFSAPISQSEIDALYKILEKIDVALMSKEEQR